MLRWLFGTVSAKDVYMRQLSQMLCDASIILLSTSSAGNSQSTVNIGHTRRKNRSPILCSREHLKHDVQQVAVRLDSQHEQINMPAISRTSGQTCLSQPWLHSKGLSCDGDPTGVQAGQQWHHTSPFRQPTSQCGATQALLGSIAWQYCLAVKPFKTPSACHQKQVWHS